MIKLTFYKVTALPGSPAANSVYFVENGNTAETYITSTDGVPKAMTNSEAIIAIVNSMIDDLPLPGGAITEQEAQSMIASAISGLPDPGLNSFQVNTLIASAISGLPAPGISSAAVDQKIVAAIQALPAPGLSSTAVDQKITTAISALPAPGLSSTAVDQKIAAAVAGISPGLSETYINQMINTAIAAYHQVPEPTISISVMSGDDVLTEIESRSVTIAGLTSAANGAVVTVKIGATTLGNATVASGAWSITGQNLSAYALGTVQVITATVSSTSATRNITIQTPILPTISISSIAGDNDITSQESSSVVISGVTNADNGSTVTVKIGASTLGTATVTSGAWSLAAQNLVGYANGNTHVISAQVGTVTATANLIIRVAPTISISPIAGDNNITSVEAVSVVISGVTSAANGATVTVKIGTTTLGTATATSGTWALAAQNLVSYANGATYTVSAQVAEVVATANLLINAAPTISITAIGGDNDITYAEAGSINISGLSNAPNTSTVTVKIGTTTLGMTTVTSGAWVLSGVPLTTYADNTSRTVSAEVGGTTATVSLVVRPAPTITLSDVGGDNDITSAEAGSITISGTTNVANGASVAVTVDSVSVGNATVTSGAWSLVAANLSAYTDGASHTVSATVAGVSASKSVLIRAGVATLTMNDVGGDNDITQDESSSIPLSGTCSTNGATVTITVDGVTLGTTTASGGTWTLSGANLKPYADGTNHTITASTGSLTASKTTKINLPAALTGIDTIMLIGASIEYGIGNAMTVPMLDYVNNYLGLTGITSIVTYGYSGADVVTIQTNWVNTIQPAIAARADGGAGVLILTMPTGNTVTTLAPYASATPATLASRKATYEQLIGQMKAQCGARNVVCMDNTFRQYGYPATTCLTDESQGSKPFNENWVEPQASLTPWTYKGSSYGNPYNIAFNWYSLYLTDSTHYTSLGYQVLARYWLDVAGACILGTVPPVLSKKAAPIGDQKPKTGRAIINYRSTAGTVRSSQFPLSNARGTTTADQVYLAPMDGYDPVLGLSGRATDLSGIVTQSGLGTGDKTYTIMNDKFRDAFIYTTSQSFVLLEEFINLAPYQPYTYQVLACRTVATGVTRWQEFSNDGTSVAGSINGGCFPGTVPNVYNGSGIADANGKARIYIRCMSGNTTGAYANAILFNPDNTTVIPSNEVISSGNRVTSNGSTVNSGS